MKKEIVINFTKNEIEINDDPYGKTITLGSLDPKNYKDSEIEDLAKTRLISGGYIIDDINSYRFKIVRN